jgi:hypothetical protein
LYPLSVGWADTSEPFALKVWYDGVVLNESAGASGRSITASAAAAKITDASISANPSNEGEVSSYVLLFTPLTALSATSKIVLQFAEEFDQHIGKSLKC